MFHNLIKPTCIPMPQNIYISAYSGINLLIDREEWDGTSHHTCDTFFFSVTSLFKQTTAVFSLSSTLAISDTPKSESDPLSHEQEIFSLHSVTSFWPWVGGRRRGHMTSQGPRNRWWRQTAPLYSCGIFSGSKSKSETAVLQRQLPINRIRST